MFINIVIWVWSHFSKYILIIRNIIFYVINLLKLLMFIIPGLTTAWRASCTLNYKAHTFFSNVIETIEMIKSIKLEEKIQVVCQSIMPTLLVRGKWPGCLSVEKGQLVWETERNPICFDMTIVCLKSFTTTQ